MRSAGRVHVAVVGGGILGVSTAANLARRGAHVTLVTDGPLAGGASGRSLSWLNSFGRRSDAYHRLRRAGLARYRDLTRTTDCAGWLRFDGGLAWAAPDDAAEQRDVVDHLRRIGYAVERLTPDEVRERVPGVDARAVPDDGAVLAPDEGWVDLPSLVEHLVTQLVADGGTVVTDARPCRPLLDGDRVSGVRTAAGETIGGDAVVLATGAAVPGAVEPLGLRMPDATSSALLVRAAPVATGLRAVLNTPRVAVRPAPGGGLVVDAGWAEREVERRPDGTYRVGASTVDGLLREASAVLAGNPALRSVGHGAGAKPIPGDGEPVVGAVPGVRGLHIAFTHSGATLGLVAGDLLAQEVLTGRRDPLLAGFGPERFA